MENYYFDCQCSDFNHTFRFVLDNSDGDVWLEARLSQFRPWYLRMWIALKYIFNKDNAYGHYDITLIKYEQLVKLQELINKAEEVQVKV